MEDVKIKKTRTKKIKVDNDNSGPNIEISLTKLIENEKNSYKYTKHGAIRQSWIRDEAKREKAGNEDIIAIRVKEELIRLDNKKKKEDEKEQLKQQKKNEAKLIRDEKKAKIKSEKVDTRGRTEKALAHNKQQGYKLQECLRKKFLEKEKQRKKDYPESDDSEEEEITIIKKKRSKSRTPDIDYRRLYEESIRKKTIKEEPPIEVRRSSSVSPNYHQMQDLQRNIFKGIL